MEWGLDIHSRSRTRDGLRPKDAPVDDTDVRTILGVGEGRQGGKTRPSGDACDSLVLWDRKAAGGLAHRRLPCRGRAGIASDSHTVEGNWGPALDAWVPSVVRAHRKSPAADSHVVHPAAAASGR